MACKLLLMGVKSSQQSWFLMAFLEQLFWHEPFPQESLFLLWLFLRVMGLIFLVEISIGTCLYNGNISQSVGKVFGFIFWFVCFVSVAGTLFYSYYK